MCSVQSSKINVFINKTSIPLNFNDDPALRNKTINILRSFGQFLYYRNL